jgi:hypothetical protein
MAVAAALAVANIYYAQPLLAAIAATYGIRHEELGIVITASQVGYGLGLLLVVPLVIWLTVANFFLRNCLQPQSPC